MRRSNLLLPVVPLALLLASCGSSGGEDATETTARPASTTTAAGSETTTTAEEAPDDGTSTSTPGGSTDGGVAEDARDVAWSSNASAFRGRDGERFGFACPPDGELTSGLWGVDTYTDDSAVCVAAVHAGLITVTEGGRVIIEIAPGEEAYQSSEANGVTSSDYGPWAGSFLFPTS